MQKVIGVTGSIGCGKSTVCKLIQNLGYNVIDCDKVGHDILLPNREGYIEVIKAFGDDILGEDGFYVQEYTVHVGKPIYPNENLSKAENVDNLMNENYSVWKNVYEDFYKKPLKYETK